MPLRDDLLQPVEGEHPSGPDLQYDKVFEQIKEARIEEDDSLPAGDWGRPAKKADRLLVIKLAGETLAQRTKDLRLVGWYLESLVRKEGFTPLPVGLDLLWKMQELFWDTVHPALDEDGTADRRIGAVETSSNLLAAAVKLVPLTRGGVNWVQYQDARAEAVSSGEVDEELQKSVNSTPKQFYVDTERLLAQSLETLESLDDFQRERYGSDYPSIGRLKTAVEAVKGVVDGLLTEKRKTEPDPVAADTEPEAQAGDIPDPFAQYDNAEPVEVVQEVQVRIAAPSQRRTKTTATVTDEQSAYDQIAAAAEFLRSLNGSSPVSYLVCSALRLGEARAADLSDSAFAVAPSTETRQSLRRLAGEGNWDELSQLCLRTMTEPCGRVWLDLQRYAWRAASELGHAEQAKAITGTVRSLLHDVPALRELILDDDTPAANRETNEWIKTEVLLPAPEPVSVEAHEEPQPELPVYVPETPSAGDAPTDVYATAVEVLRRGRVAEAISLLARDSEQQPSGRMRFRRRVQMAELCLAAEKPEVAYPVLRDLSGEMERRSLDTWESAATLAQPLALLLRCLDQRTGSESEREAVFERLCRLDPQAALSARR